MRVRALLAGLGVAGCVALVTAGIAIAYTKITIREERTGDFHGKIFSRKQKCEGGRVVTVYKLEGIRGQHPASDRKIASDISEHDGDHGVWSVTDTGAKPGRYYAVARESPGCRRGFSKIA